MGKTKREPDEGKGRGFKAFSDLENIVKGADLGLEGDGREEIKEKKARKRVKSAKGDKVTQAEPGKQEVAPPFEPAYTETAEAVPPPVEALETVEAPAAAAPEAEKLTPVPRNSRVYIVAELAWRNTPETHNEYPGGEKEYIEKYFESLRNPRDLGHEVVVPHAGFYGIANSDEAIKPLTPEELGLFIDERVIAPAVAAGMPGPARDYKKRLQEEGLVAGHKSARDRVNEQSKDTELKLKGEPQFKYTRGYIRGEFNLQDAPYPKRGITAAIPALAATDLENQKAHLQAALHDMMRMNNYKANPVVAFEGAKLNLKFGDATGLIMPIQRVEKALEAARMLPGGFRAYTLEQYRQAKQFREDHKESDFTAVKSVDLRRQITDADRAIKQFEAFLFKLPATDVKDRHLAGNYVRAEVLNRLWRLKVGEDGLKLLREKVGASKTKIKAGEAPKAGGAGEAKAAEVKPAKKDAEPDTTPDAKKGAEAKEGATETKEERDRWTSTLPFDNPEFRKSAAGFYQAVNKEFGYRWDEFLSNYVGEGRKRKRKKDAITRIADEFNLTVPTAIRLAGIKVLEGIDAIKGSGRTGRLLQEHIKRIQISTYYKDEQKEFERLCGLSRGEVDAEVTRELSRHSHLNYFPPEPATKADLLRAYLALRHHDYAYEAQEEYPWEEEFRDKEDTKASIKEEGKSETEESSPPTEPGIEAEAEETEGEIETEVEAESASEYTGWESLKPLLDEHGSLSIELLQKETGLEGEALDELLTQTLKDIGYWEEYEEGLEEYNAESSTEYLVKAVNVYSRRYESKAAKAQAPKKEQTAAEGAEDGDEAKPAKDEQAAKAAETKLPKTFETVAGTSMASGLVLKDSSTNREFIGIIVDKNVHTVALPKDFKAKDKAQFELAAKGVTDLSKELKGDFTPRVKVAGALLDTADGDLSLQVSVDGANVTIAGQDFANRKFLHPDVRDKAEQSPLFKIMLMQRLSKFGSIAADKLTEEDRKQMALTNKTIIELLASPHENDLSFTQMVAGEALKLKLQPAEKK